MTPSEIHKICEEYNIKKYIINDDMSISVNGHVDLTHKNLKSLPIKFKEVGDYFYCSYNQLTSLEGCPGTVGGYFSCSNNQLTSLEGCPETVSGYFNCHYNQLTSLEYCPESVGGGFSCHSNQLTSLKYCPETVGGGFNCYRNQLTNFDGLPEFFESPIYLYGNPVYEIYKLFNQDPRCIYWLREYDVIMDMTVVEYRLEEVYHRNGYSK